ncbi:MAG: hypothetical protein AB8G86_07290, partial [Saprospiraceae bacterium]
MKQGFLTIFVCLYLFNGLIGQPTNNSCATALQLTTQAEGCEIPLTGTTVGATASGELPNPSCANFGSGLDVWYQVTVPQNGELYIELSQNIAGVNDYAFSVYTGVCGSLSEITCNDDNGLVLFPKVHLTNQTPGTTLYVRVWEFANDLAGRFSICAYQAYKVPENDLAANAIHIP